MSHLYVESKKKKQLYWDFPGGAVVKNLRSQCMGPGFDPTCMPQLRVRMPQLSSP